MTCNRRDVEVGIVRVYLLLHNLELLDQDGSKLLDYVRAVVGGLEADHDLFDDVVVDAGQVDVVVGGMEVVVEVHFDRDSSVEAGGGRWGVGDSLATFVGGSGRVCRRRIHKRMGTFCLPC